LELGFLCNFKSVTLIATPCGVLAAIKPKHSYPDCWWYNSYRFVRAYFQIIAILMVSPFFSIRIKIWRPALAEVKQREFFGLYGQVGFSPKNGLKHLLLTKPYPCHCANADFVRFNRAEMDGSIAVLNTYVFAWSKALSARTKSISKSMPSKNTMLPVITGWVESHSGNTGGLH